MKYTQEQLERASVHATAELVHYKKIYNKDFSVSYIGALDNTRVGEKVETIEAAIISAKEYREHAREVIKDI